MCYIVAAVWTGKPKIRYIQSSSYAIFGSEKKFNMGIFSKNLAIAYALVKSSLALMELAYRAVVIGGARGALAPPEFWSSVNPIPTRGDRLCPPHYC